MADPKQIRMPTAALGTMMARRGQLAMVGAMAREMAAVVVVEGEVVGVVVGEIAGAAIGATWFPRR